MFEYVARAMRILTGATAQEAAIAGRISDAMAGAGLTIAGKEIPVNIRESVGYTLEGVQALGGAQSIGLGVTIASTSSVTPALPVFLAAAGGYEIGTAFNQIYERISGQGLGEDIYDLLHPEEAALLKKYDVRCRK